MHAIEFETCLENGLIRLPNSYQHWQEGKHAKVIVLVEEPSDVEKPANGGINRHAGSITLTQDPLAFQQSIRDEWL